MFLRSTVLAARRAAAARPTTLRSLQATQLAATSRTFSTPAAESAALPEFDTDAERAVYLKLRSALAPTALEVRDVSGGCGAMYELNIESPQFAGMNKVQQQRLVNQVLKEDIAKWHGVRMTTKPSPALQDA
ncbi:hypothetical protein AMAG_03602 [Allomyces macrogynus ATCC 38327]|uniref:BolA protein n=1 Tax=Allomyces macrogynus (strain ATCC 38327) TaxID=578462 RepID=A0A0L0SA34_ALLM3|nr:hypothetical protein AMAG_03602 [Allomyces macrogynus ATCC 38327]|eukprot:KNE59297.1 hypothetical protein AMAG_03602 [Allomyces macrogynus ATCC 38327]